MCDRGTVFLVASQCIVFLVHSSMGKPHHCAWPAPSSAHLPVSVQFLYAANTTSLLLGSYFHKASAINQVCDLHKLGTCHCQWMMNSSLFSLPFCVKFCFATCANVTCWHLVAAFPGICPNSDSSTQTTRNPSLQAAPLSHPRTRRNRPTTPAGQAGPAEPGPVSWLL